MPAPLRKQTEDAVIAALRATLLYVRAVEPYNGELHVAKTPEDIYRVLKGRVPAILVFTGDGKSTSIDMRQQRALMDVDLNLIVVSANARSREERTRGENDIQQMMQDIERVLLGRDSGINGVGRFELLTEESLIHAPDLTAWRVRYTVPMVIEAIDPEADAPTLLELFGTGKLPVDEGGTALVTISEKFDGV